MDNNTKIAMRISTVSIIANVFLALFKFIAGIIGRSSAMVSDAVHSASDVFSTIIVIIGTMTSGKESDKQHPYGHERLECVSAIILAFILCITGIGIGVSGFNKIFVEDVNELPVPTALALVASIVSVVVKEAMYWYTIIGAKKINSGSLKADAWHHRSDALSSVGSFIGIIGAMCGVKVLDPIVSIIIALMIIKVAYDIAKDGFDKMVDKSCDEKTIVNMSTIVAEQDGVKRVDLLKTRLFGNRIYVDIEISVDENLTIREGHNIAQCVHDAIEKDFPLVKHCMVHVNPY